LLAALAPISEENCVLGVVELTTWKSQTPKAVVERARETIRAGATNVGRDGKRNGQA